MVTRWTRREATYAYLDCDTLAQKESFFEGRVSIRSLYRQEESPGKYFATPGSSALRTS